MNACAPSHPPCHGSKSGTPVAAMSRVLRVTKVRPRVIAVAAISVSITGRLRRAVTSHQSRAAATSTGNTRSAKIVSTITKHGRPAAVVVPVEEAKRIYPLDRPSFAALLMGIPHAVETERDPSPLREVEL